MMGNRSSTGSKACARSCYSMLHMSMRSQAVGVTSTMPYSWPNSCRMDCGAAWNIRILSTQLDGIASSTIPLQRQPYGAPLEAPSHLNDRVLSREKALIRS
jgi:hypothetical protein